MWLAPSQDTKYEHIFSKQLQPKENATGRKAVPLERANFSSEVQEYKNVYYISKACHNPYKSIKHQPAGNVEKNFPFEIKVTHNMEKSYCIDRVITHFTFAQFSIRATFLLYGKY